MVQQHTIRWDIKYKILVSITGLLVIVALTVFPPTVTGDFSWRKTVIGLVFSIFCSSGVLAVFSPSNCGKIIEGKKQSVISDSSSAPKEAVVLLGHHPTCGKFFAHTFQIGNKTFCAACIGLLLGGLLALVGTVGYFFCNWNITGHSVTIVLLGVFGIVFGLFQFKFNKVFRLFANTVFVLGALLILIGIDELIHSLFFDLFVVSVIAFWLFTRISLSQVDHELICSGCEAANCSVRA
ncbi:MAG: hypothetical protein NWF06_00995 [Candidatus Bathyarchaeota archaeon]|nr:hypothetical protein [Candidatus Bathyarchaeum sp.]